MRRHATITHIATVALQRGSTVSARGLHSSRWLSASSGGSNTPRIVEMGTVIDQYVPQPSMFRSFMNFGQSTQAVVQLREALNGWAVPAFKEEAARVYSDVGQALAAADEVELRRLTTPSCFATMRGSLRDRPAGQRHLWDMLSVEARVLQVRIGHHKSAPERRFAQVTCEIDAKLIWTITDKKGVRVGGVGSVETPHEAKDFWVLERCIAMPLEPPAWRLKERLAVPKKT